MKENNESGETTWVEKLAQNTIRYRWAVILRTILLMGLSLGLAQWNSVRLELSNLLFGGQSAAAGVRCAPEYLYEGRQCNDRPYC